MDVASALRRLGRRPRGDENNDSSVVRSESSLPTRYSARYVPLTTVDAARVVWSVMLASCHPDADHGGDRRFVGVRRFLDSYFAATLGTYLGPSVTPYVVRIDDPDNIGARVTANRSNLFLTLLGNFDHWDGVVRMAASLPDAYFRFRDERCERDDDREEEKDHHHNDRCLATSIAALGLAAMYESLMREDLRRYVPHYVPLTALFGCSISDDEDRKDVYYDDDGEENDDDDALPVMEEEAPRNALISIVRSRSSSRTSFNSV